MTISAATYKDGSDFSCQVRTKMMQDYRAIQPVHAGGAIAAARNEQGVVNLLSLGSDRKTLFAFVRDEASGAGWSQTTVDTGGDPVVALAPAPTSSADSHPYVLAGKNPSFLTEVAASGFVGVRHSYGGTIAGTKPAFQVNAVHGNIDPGTARMATLNFPKATSSNLSATVTAWVKEETSIESFGLFIDNSSQPVLQADKVVCTAGKDAWWSQGSTLVYSHNGVLGLATSIEAVPRQKGIDIASHLLLRTSSFPHLHSPVVDFAADVNDGGEVRVVALNDDAGVCALHTVTFRPPAAPGGDWQEILTTPRVDRPQFETVRMFRDANGRVQLFMTDDKGELWQCEEAPPGAEEAWTIPVPLGVNAALLTAALNGEGVLELFAAAQDGALTRLWQDEESDWHIAPIETKSLSETEPASVFTATLGLIDDVGRPASGFQVDVTASEPAQVVINNRPYWLDPSKPAVPVQANPFGSINVAMVVENSLYSPTVCFDSSWFDKSGGKIEVRPDVAAYDYLRNIESVSDEALLAAKDPLTGDPVIPTAQQGKVDDVKRAISQATSMAEGAYAPDANLPRALAKLQGRRGIRYRPPGEVPTKPKLREADLPGAGCWHFGRSATGAFFAGTLQSTEFNALLAQAQPVEERRAALAAAGLTGFLGVDWGDVWEAVKNGVVTAFNFAVEKARAVIEFVIEGVRLVWDFVLDELEQVWDVVGGIFNALGTALGTVVGWLLEVVGFIFDWTGSIEANRQVLYDLLTKTTVERLQSFQISEQKAKVEEWLNSVFNVETINTQVGQLGSDGNTTVANMVNEPAASPAAIFASVGDSMLEPAMWLFDKASDFLPQMNVAPAPVEIPALNSAIESFLNDVDKPFADLGEKIASKIEELMETMGEIVTFEDQSLYKLIQLFEALIDAIRVFALSIVDAACSLFEALVNLSSEIIEGLNTKLEIPFLSAFYLQVFKRELTILDLLCMILAVPMAIFGGGDDELLAAGEGNPAIAMAGVALVVWALFNLAAEYLDLQLGQPLIAMPVAIMANLSLAFAAVLGLLDLPGWGKMTADEQVFWVLGAVVVAFDLVLTYLAWGASLHQQKATEQAFSNWGNRIVAVGGIAQVYVGLIQGTVRSRTSKPLSFWAILMSVGAGIASAARAMKVSSGGTSPAEKYKVPYMIGVGLLTVPIFGYHLGANNVTIFGEHNRASAGPPGGGPRTEL